MNERPTITAEKLCALLQEHDILTEADLISLLGSERGGLTLNFLERALVRGSIIGGAKLLALKGEASGLQTFDDPELRIRKQIDATVARTAGAVVVDRDPLTVAFVEDLQENIDLVAVTLKQADFETWVMTAEQFSTVYRKEYQGETIDVRPQIKDIFAIFDEAIRRRASDIHLSVSVPPAVRVDGSIVYLPVQPLDYDWLHTQVSNLAGERGMAVVKEHAAYDFAYTYGNVRFRINLGLDRYGDWMVARKLPAGAPTADELGLPQAIRDFTELERGLVLVTGPTGSGKSTTLACLLTHIAKNQSRHLITLEDPIEFYLESGRSVVHQRELGRDFFDFSEALRQALRQDPDVVLVGELRDLDTMATAITAAETGHLVFGTLHTYDAASSLARLVGSFPQAGQEQIRAQLAYILKGIVSQTLLPLSSGKGRAAAYEVLVSTPAIQTNLRKTDGHTQLKQTMETSSKDGMQTMDMALADLVLRGRIRESDAIEKARDVEEFQRRLSAG